MTEQPHAEPQHTPRQPYSAPTLQPLQGNLTASKIGPDPIEDTALFQIGS